MAKSQKRSYRPLELSIDDQAAIERCRQIIQTVHAPNNWPLLCPPALDLDNFLDGPNLDEVPTSMSANLQVELRDYTCALFDCEAAAYNNKGPQKLGKLRPEDIPQD